MKNCFFCAFFFSFSAILYAEELGKPGCLDAEEAVSLLETAEDFLSKVDGAYPSCKNQSECGGNLPSTYLDIAKKLISNVRENFPTNSKVKVHHDKPRDCSEIFTRGHNESGVYAIWPSESCTPGKQLQVYCDMDTDYGAWTVIQRRGQFSDFQDFYQSWENYKNGFGNITQDFWLGNENIRVLCYKGCEIRFDLQSNDGTKRYAIYRNFNLARISYTLSISHYTGNAGDGMTAHNNYAFSTKDQGYTEKAIERQGGWWYSNDNKCNVNGAYRRGGESKQSVYWHLWLQYKNLASVEMKVRAK